jgi:hypothetical protein
VAFIPLEESDAPTAKLFMVWRREDHRPLLNAMLDIARAIAEPVVAPTTPPNRAGRVR